MDFSYGNKVINASGPIKPSDRNMPGDPRTRVEVFADIANIPTPYVGMTITVLQDETNDNKMTEYKVKSLKANSFGVANSLVDEVVRYVDYLGATSGGGSSSGGASVEIVNDLTTGGANKALSAEQGKVIKSSLDNMTQINEDLKLDISDILERLGILEGYHRNKTNEVPILYLTGDTSTMSSDVSVNLNGVLKDVYNDTLFEGTVSTKWQGSSSLSFPKKNYSIKLKDSTNTNKVPIVFEDWYSTNEFHLKANYADYSMVRNVVGATLAREIDRSTYPNNARGIIDGFPIVIYINDEWWGCYTWNLKQDDKLFAMDTKTNSTTEMVYRGALGGWVLSNFEYRSDGTKSTDTDAKLQTWLDWCKNSDDNEFKLNIDTYCSKENLIDYWLFADIACATDNMINNWTIATWDGIKWYSLWYDLDIIFGLYRNANISYHPSSPTANLLTMQYTTPNPIWEKLNRCFKTEIIARYRELRASKFTASYLADKFVSYQKQWGVELQKEYTKWTGRPNSTDNVSMIEQWITERLNYLDTVYVEEESPVLIESLVLSSTELQVKQYEDLTVNTIQTTITPEYASNKKLTWESDNNNIATVNENGRVVGKSAGKCIITCSTTDGSNISKQCNVTVIATEMEGYIPIVLNGSENWGLAGAITTTGSTLAFEIPNWCTMPYINDSTQADIKCEIPTIAYSNRNVDINQESIMVATTNGYLIMRIAKNKLSTQDVAGLKQYLSNNPMNVMVGMNNGTYIPYVINNTNTFIDKCSESWFTTNNVAGAEIDIINISKTVNNVYRLVNNTFEVQPLFNSKDANKYNTYLSTVGNIPNLTLAYLGVHVKSELLSERTLQGLKAYLQQNPITVYIKAK